MIWRDLSRLLQVCFTSIEFSACSSDATVKCWMRCMEVISTDHIRPRDSKSKLFKESWRWVEACIISDCHGKINKLLKWYGIGIFPEERVIEKPLSPLRHGDRKLMEVNYINVPIWNDLSSRWSKWVAFMLIDILLSISKQVMSSIKSSLIIHCESTVLSIHA